MVESYLTEKSCDIKRTIYEKSTAHKIQLLK